MGAALSIAVLTFAETMVSTQELQGSSCTAFWSKVRRATRLTRMEVALTFGQTVDWASDAVYAEEVTGMDGVPATVLVFVWGFVVVGVLGDVVKAKLLWDQKRALDRASKEYYSAAKKPHQQEAASLASRMADVGRWITIFEDAPQLVLVPLIQACYAESALDTAVVINVLGSSVNVFVKYFAFLEQQKRAPRTAYYDMLEEDTPVLEIKMERVPLEKEHVRGICNKAHEWNSTTLQLSECQIDDEALQGFEERGQFILPGALTILYLNNNEIGDEGGKALGKALQSNRALTYLGLDRNQIGDEGAKALAESGFGALTRLYLHGNKIEDAGAIALAEGLENNGALTILNLNSNEIGDVGAQALAASGFGALTTLYLSGNHISEEAKKTIRDAWGDRGGDLQL